jgi:excisionase family DNA binding protein
MMTSVDGMRTREVARALNLGEQRIRQLAAAGKLAYTQTPYGRLYDPQDVARLAAERAARQRSSTEAAQA